MWGVVKDWSHEQLQKHSREIQSLIGNFFLRITSPKITALITTDPPPDFSDENTSEWSPSPGPPIMSDLSSLTHQLELSLGALEMSEALERITDVLKRVSPPCSRLHLHTPH
jgi:methionyl-tRNA synthetase